MNYVNLAEHLSLTRPLTVFDLETTGTNTDKDRIVQIGITVHAPEKVPIRWKSLINPGVPIPEEVTKVHGITDAMVAAAPKLEDYLTQLISRPMSPGRDYGGFNIKFDLRVFRSECRRLKALWDWEESGAHVIDMLRVYQTNFPRTLQDAYKEYVDQDGFPDAHDAEVDVAATECVLVGQLNRHPHVPRTVPELAAYCFPTKPGALDAEGKIVWKNGEACLSFGKNNGRPLRTLERKYMLWMLEPGRDFARDTKEIIKAALDGNFPKK